MNSWLESLQVIILVFAGLGSLGAILYLMNSVSSRNQTIRQMLEEHEKLMRSFNELDEQAKLIVRTDLELNKAQEELDKRLIGINALQRASKQISQALNETEIFQRLGPDLFEELGFTLMLIATVDENDNPRKRASINIPEDKIVGILNRFEKDERLKIALSERHTFSSNNASRQSKEKIVAIFETEHFILAPIFTQNTTTGFIFVGNRYNSQMVTQGDEELVGILAGQIGQNIANAQLFEKVFRSSQELEIKVKERTKQLATALEQVNDISQKKSDFISAVSHELRTPLTSIKGYAAILMAGKIGDIPIAVKERLAKINTHSDNLVSMINNLLDIARIESGRVELNFESKPTKVMIDNVIDLLTPQIKDKEIKLSVDLPKNIDTIYVDSSHAERIFINLVNNAIKFTPKGGAINISASPAIDKGYITFFIQDTGIGIAPDDLKKLFDEFFRVENEINQNVKGTGLGLTLVKNIVEAHHGSVNVKSHVGAGTTFYFTLPVSKEAYEAAIVKKTV